jgi:hypothetical protein
MKKSDDLATGLQREVFMEKHPLIGSTVVPTTYDARHVAIPIALILLKPL